MTIDELEKAAKNREMVANGDNAERYGKGRKDDGNFYLQGIAPKVGMTDVSYYMDDSGGGDETEVTQKGG